MVRTRLGKYPNGTKTVRCRVIQILSVLFGLQWPESFSTTERNESRLLP